MSQTDTHGKAAYWELDPQTPDNVDRVFLTDGYKLLSKAQQSALFNYTSPSFTRSAHMRGVLKGVATEAFFDKSAADQAADLIKVLQTSPSPQVNRGINAETTGYTTAYSLSTPVVAQYSEYSTTGNVKGYKTTATFANPETQKPEQVINIYTLKAGEADQIAKAYSVIPYAFRRYIKTITQTINSSNSFNTGKDLMAIRDSYTPTYGMIAMASAHELGHSLTFNDPDSSDYSHTKVWQEAVTADQDPVSSYGSSNYDEGFAEFTQLVISSLGDPYDIQAVQTMYPHRWEAFKQFFESLNGNGSLEKLYSPVENPFGN